MRSLHASTSLLAFVLATAAFAAGFQPPPSPSRWVTDTAGFITPETRAHLDVRLERYQKATGHQVIVWIGRSTGEVPLEEWAVRTFEAWGIGRGAQDDGLAVFVFAEDRKMRIEVGYGLEGDVPDATAHRIIQEQAIPLMKAGDPDGAIDATVSALLAKIGGEVSPPPARQRPARTLTGTIGAMSLGEKVFWGVVLIALLVFIITNPRLAFLLLWSLGSGSSRRSSWGGGGGGGFSGGGGRSGGGGASGSW